jgi:hypothetical protein
LLAEAVVGSANRVTDALRAVLDAVPELESWEEARKRSLVIDAVVQDMDRRELVQDFAERDRPDFRIGVGVSRLGQRA